MGTPKKILFITGTRADFGKIKPLIRETQKSQFEPYIFATGMHLLSRYGYTVLEIQKSGFENIFTHFNQTGSNNHDMDLALAHTIQGLALYVREFLPDLIVVHGDRIETLAGAVVGALNNIPVAHIEGGELSGTVDELIRHSVSKLSHLHFVAHEEARRRLVQMGEREDSIFVIGSPDVDIMLSADLPNLVEVKKKYEIPFSEFAIFIYHPVTTELSHLKDNVESVAQALRACALNFVVIYPNNDQGSEIIFEMYKSFTDHPRFRILPSMRFEYFLTLLKNSVAIVGNSSCGIREAPIYGIPTVNIGTRQKNRFHYPSILNVPDSTEEILSALKHLPKGVAPSVYFGKGDSACRFIECLCDPEIWNIPRQKQFLDLKK